MQIAMIGLGRMGMNMARRMMQDHRVAVYNRTPDRTQQMVREGAMGVVNLSELSRKLDPPRIVWMMLPAGPVVDAHIESLGVILSAGDIVIDGSNTFYKDDIRRAEKLRQHQIHLLDAGVSGGIWGLEKGYCLMIGGDKSIFELIEPVLKTLAPPEGYLYCGPSGAGHYVKMIHNAIEYGMMQAYGEGFELLETSPYSNHLDYAKISHLWNQGSVIRSWLLELAETVFLQNGRLSDIRGYVEDSGEGRWSVQQAIDAGVCAPVIALSLMQRFRSRQADAFSDKVIAALRKEFGGHAVLKNKPQEDR